VSFRFSWTIDRVGYADEMSREPDPLTLSKLARRAAEIVDPDDEDAAVGDLERALEDEDEPVTAIQNLEERLAIASEGADYDLEQPVIAVANAVILYLAFRRDELNDEPHRIMRLAARAEWQGHPPDYVREWLADRGVDGV
jgi:hypothetical protein